MPNSAGDGTPNLCFVEKETRCLKLAIFLRVPIRHFREMLFWRGEERTTGVASEQGDTDSPKPHPRPRMITSSRRRAVLIGVIAIVVAATVALVAVELTKSASGHVGPDISSAICSSSTCNANYLNSVSCSSRSFCVAVGYYRNRSYAEKTLIERWDGHSWGVTKSANTKYGKDKLASVSCTSSSFCMAVGWDSEFEVGFTNVIEEWNGSTWTMIDRQPRVFAKLEGVQCFSPTRCVAVGYDEKAMNVPQTLVEQWNGLRWSVIPSANEASGNVMFNDLHGLSCVNSSRCLAVGSFEELNNDQRTEVEHNIGGQWSLVRSPDPGASADAFFAVSCPVAQLCFAVGDLAPVAHSGHGYRPLIERWNGTTWHKVANPTSPFPNDVLTSIACVDARLCFAVGVENQDSSGHSILDQWNGRTWSTLRPPVSQAPGGVPLNGVTCVNASDCYAVGWYSNGSSEALSLIEHWNGYVWNGVSAPNDFG